MKGKEILVSRLSFEYNLELFKRIIILLYYREESKKYILKTIGACNDANSIK